ncbi:MAG: hypothetical protein K6B67_04675 [Lachnospiraceae bacterium]|nr:hypothetical protein [Lachnospiraceae bacterium]
MIGKCYKKNKFWLAILGFSFVLFWNNFTGATSNINTTMLSFTYKYGFISRGLLGTIYEAINALLPWDLHTYGWALIFFEASFLLFVIVLCIFCNSILKRVNKDNKQDVQILIILIFMISIPMFSSKYNLGRIDMYCLMCSLICMYLLTIKKMEWLVIPISAIGVMFHQGHVFMFMGMVLAMVIYNMFSEIKDSEGEIVKNIVHNKSAKRYLILFIFTFAIVSILFIWFEGFSRINGEGIVDEIIKTASLMGPEHDYHEDVVAHEILGQDLSKIEWEYHKKNMIEFPIYCLLVMPYIVMAIKFFRRLIKTAQGKINKLRYSVIIFGIVTILPDMILKVDFGRWIYCILIYYLVVMATMYAVGDKHFVETFNDFVLRIKEKCSFAVIFLIYPLMFQPHMHIAISPITDRLARLINVYINLWVPWD